MKIHLISSLILCLFVVDNIYSSEINKKKNENKITTQSVLVRGRVVDDFGEPVAGVIVTNGNNQNCTDSKGYYEINADTTLVLTYSFLGEIKNRQKIIHNKIINCQIDI